VDKLSILSKINVQDQMCHSIAVSEAFNSIQDQPGNHMSIFVTNENIFQFYPRSTKMAEIMYKILREKLSILSKINLGGSTWARHQRKDSFNSIQDQLVYKEGRWQSPQGLIFQFYPRSTGNQKKKIFLPINSFNSIQDQQGQGYPPIVPCTYSFNSIQDQPGTHTRKKIAEYINFQFYPRSTLFLF